jgi:hypothetical protein
MLLPAPQVINTSMRCNYMYEQDIAGFDYGAEMRTQHTSTPCILDIVRKAFPDA